MNGRTKAEPTPEGRIAAVVISHAVNVWNKRHAPGNGPDPCDYADVSKAIKPFMDVELIRAEVKGARKVAGRALTDVMREFEKELAEAERALPDPYNL